MLQTQKIDKEKLDSRFKTSIYIAFYYLLFFVLAGFSDPRGKDGNGWTWWMGKTANLYVSYVCTILFIIALLPLSYLISKELSSCFLKNNKKQNVLIIAFLIYAIQVVPTIVYLPFTHSSLHWHTSPENLTYIFISISLLFPIISYFVLLALIKKCPDKTKFNVIWFPLLCVFIGWTFEWIQYLTFIRYWSTLFLLVVCVVGTDVFGYLFGSWLGRHQLSKISAKKTWEGAIFGVAVTTCIVLLFLYLFGFSPNKIGDNAQGSFIGIQIGKETIIQTPIWWVSCTLIVMAICIVSICGDLLFSWFKRKNNIKDFSNFLKEHGGILDRIDALVVVMSFFGVISTIVAFIFTFIHNDGTNLVFPTAKFSR